MYINFIISLSLCNFGVWEEMSLKGRRLLKVEGKKEFLNLLSFLSANRYELVPKLQETRLH